MVDRASRHGLELTKKFDVEVASAELGTLHDSFTGFYKYTKPKPRSIGVTDPAHESVASTAATRFKTRPQDALPGLLERLDDGTLRTTQI
jgi:hypothetical protein